MFLFQICYYSQLLWAPPWTPRPHRPFPVSLSWVGGWTEPLLVHWPVFLAHFNMSCVQQTCEAITVKAMSNQSEREPWCSAHHLNGSSSRSRQAPASSLLQFIMEAQRSGECSAFGPPWSLRPCSRRGCDVDLSGLLGDTEWCVAAGKWHYVKLLWEGWEWCITELTVLHLAICVCVALSVQARDGKGKPMEVNGTWSSFWRKYRD